MLCCNRCTVGDTTILYCTSHTRTTLKAVCYSTMQEHCRYFIVFTLNNRSGFHSVPRNVRAGSTDCRGSLPSVVPDCLTTPNTGMHQLNHGSIRFRKAPDDTVTAPTLLAPPLSSAVEYSSLESRTAFTRMNSLGLGCVSLTLTPCPLQKPSLSIRSSGRLLLRKSGQAVETSSATYGCTAVALAAERNRRGQLFVHGWKSLSDLTVDVRYHRRIYAYLSIKTRILLFYL